MEIIIWEVWLEKELGLLVGEISAQSLHTTPTRA
jgi:hypothetical protein